MREEKLIEEERMTASESVKNFMQFCAKFNVINFWSVFEPISHRVKLH